MTFRSFLAFLLILFTGLLFPFCKGKGSTSYVELQGRRLTEATLKKEMPDRYRRIRQQYDTQIFEMLKELAQRKMFELEAKSLNQSVDEYIQGIVTKAPLPTDEDVRVAYEEFRKSGDIQKQSLNEVRGQIFEYLRKQRGQELVQADLTRLQKKYGFDVPRVKVDIANEPVRNNPDGKVVIVEFSDFECPFCQRAQATTAKIRETYGDKIKWVFKDFPLSFHQHAMGAHIAANCVYKLDREKFWPFFDRIFSTDRTPDTLSGPGLEKAAKGLGIDPDKFRTCLGDAEIRKEIEEDIAQGESLGVSGTPAFFINGRMISGAQPFSAFQGMIDSEL